MINTTGLIDNTDGKLQSILKFAENHPERASLERCLKRLIEQASDLATAVELYSDWAPQSLSFVRRRLSDNKALIVGGLIYHGRTGVDPLSVSVDDGGGWGLHT